MVSKTVQPLVIDLNIKGAEKLAGLKSSFRDLAKTVGLTDSGLEEARQGIIKYAKSANQSEALIRGQIKAFEGLREQAALGGKLYLELGTQIAQLKSDLRGSSDAVEEQRAALLKAGQAAKGSAVDIRSVVAELERLQKSARPGSSAFAQLSKDIAVLKSQLKETNVEVKKFNAGFEISQRPAMSLEKIQRQVGRLTEGLKGLNFVSDDFLNVQQRIALLGQVQSATIGRQQVIARERMFAGQAFEAFAAGPAGKLDLPKTVAALNLEINELQDRLSNTVPGQTYANLTVEIANKQRELQRILTGTADAYDKVAAAQDRSTRVAQKIADIQEYQATTPGRMAPGVGGYRDPETGAIIARGQGQIADRAAYRRRGESFVEEVVSAAQRLGAVPALPMAGTTTAPGTGAFMSGANVKPKIAPEARLYSSTGERPDQPSRGFPGDVEAIAARRAIGPQQPGPSGQAYIYAAEARRKEAEATKAAADAVKNYRAEIDKARKANDGSINSSNRLRTAIIRFRDTLPPTNKEFADLTKQINNLDRQSERVSRRMSRRRMSPMQMTQAAGAVLSGGIFGGPEGFVGGAAGALVGGVGGAFAGSAIGAQVGMIRKSLGRVAETVAEINSMKIALAGVSESAEDYQKSFADVISISRQFLFPIDKAIGEFTRLKAAVVGAGFGTEETTDVFRGFAAAILATGGNSEKLSGALLAASQVFSKGKVQAEELRGQIGERLPGAFTTFAQSIGVSSVELDDMLRKGEVSTENFVEFTRTLFARYEKTADTLGSAPEKAGERLELALSIATLKFGGFFQKVGAGFQDYIAGLVNLAIENEKKLKLMAARFLAFGQQIATTIKRAVTSMIQVFKPFFDFVGRGLNAVFDRMQMAQREIGVRKEGVDPRKIYKSVLSGFKEQEGVTGPGNFGLSIKQKEEVQRRYSQALAAFLGEESFNESVDKYLEMMGEFQPGEDLLGTSLGNLENLLAGAGGGDATGGGTGDKGPKSQLEQLKAQYESIMRSSKGVLEIEKMRQQQALQLARATADNNQKLITTTNLNNISLDFAEKEIQIENKLLDALSAANKLKLEKDQIQARLNAQLEYQNAMKLLSLEYSGAVTAENQRAAIAAEATSKALADQVFSLREQLGLVTDNERIARFRQEQEKQFGQDDPRVAEATDLFRQTVAPTFAEGLSQKMRELNKDLKELINPINQVAFAADTIGAAFGKAFSDVVTGSASAKEALAGMMQSIGQSFIQMAAQIIAKQTTMIILGTIMKALGIAGGGGGFESAPLGEGFTTGASASSFDAVGAGIFTPKANGGPVTGGQPYIVGERGPELFIPFQHGNITSNEELKAQMREASSTPMAFAKPGADGKNGDDTITTSETRESKEARETREVMLPFQQGDNTTSNNRTTDRSYADRLRETREERSYADRLRETREERSYADRLRETREVMLPFTRSAEQASMVAAERETAQAISNPGSIDVRYESTVVNGVEYVTAEQHRQGMAQAAERGRVLTLQALQNSVKSRRKVGLA